MIFDIQEIKFKIKNQIKDRNIQIMYQNIIYVFIILIENI